jgi:ankyrin repeat protein
MSASVSAESSSESKNESDERHKNFIAQRLGFLYRRRVTQEADDSKSDPSVVYFDGNTALHLAAQRGRIGQVQNLLKDGAVDPGAVNRYRQNALHLACEYVKTEIALLLIRDGRTDVNAMSHAHNPEAVLHMCCDYRGAGLEEVVDELLFTNGIDVNIERWDGDSPLTMAVKSGNVAVATKLLAHPDINVMAGDAFWTAVRNRSCDMVKIFLDSKKVPADVCVEAFHYGCGDGNIELVRLFLSLRYQRSHRNSPFEPGIPKENGDNALVCAC